MVEGVGRGGVPTPAPSTLAESVVFRGPTGPLEGAVTLRQVVGGLAKQLKQLDVRHQLENGDTVMTVYDVDLGMPGGPIAMAELLRIVLGEIAEIELLFDPSRLSGGSA